MFWDCYRFFVHSFSLWQMTPARTDLNSNRSSQLKAKLVDSPCSLSARQVHDNILSDSIFPSPAGIMWRRRAAVMIWTRGTTAGRSYTLTSSGFPLTKACCVPCWEWGLSSLPLPRVSVHSQIHLNTATHTAERERTHTHTESVKFQNSIRDCHCSV